MSETEQTSEGKQEKYIICGNLGDLQLRYEYHCINTGQSSNKGQAIPDYEKRRICIWRPSNENLHESILILLQFITFKRQGIWGVPLHPWGPLLDQAPSRTRTLSSYLSDLTGIRYFH